RGLAGAVRAEEAVHFTAPHDEVEPVERPGAAEGLDKPRDLDRVLHASDATLASHCCEARKSMTAGTRDEQALREIVEQLGRLLAEWGLPRMAARVIFVLMTA